MVFFSAACAFVGCFLLLLSYFAGHGNFDFRPNMAEDWIIYGLAYLSFLAAAALLFGALLRRRSA